MDTLDTASNFFVNGTFWSNVILTLSNSKGEADSFSLNSYDDDINKKNKGGMYLKDLTYTRKSDGSANILIVNVVDDTSCVIEEKLTKYFRNLNFTYKSIDVVGERVQEKTHGPYNLQVVNWHTTLTAYGSQIRIEAISTGYANLQKSFKPGTCFIGPPHKAVEEIFKSCNIGYKIKTQEGKEIGSIEETMPVFVKNREGENQNEKVHKKYIFHKGTISNFIEEIKKDARAKNPKHKRNYVFRYSDKVTGNGEPLGIFMSEDGYSELFFNDREHTFSFEYNTKNSNIVNWSPYYEGKELLGIGGEEYIYSNEEGKTEEVKAEGSLNESKENGNWYREIFNGTREDAANAATYFLNRRRFSAKKAVLKVVNYGSVEVLDVITVKVIGNDGTVHHTSGKWIVLTVIDNIQGGIITTDLELVYLEPLQRDEGNISDRYLSVY